MECNKCKTDIPKESKFCLKCGEEIKHTDRMVQVMDQYFALGVVLGCLKGNKKERTRIKKSLSKVSYDLAEIYENPEEYLSKTVQYSH